MPMYVWEHKETGDQIEVLREIKDMDILPDGVDPGEKSKWFRRMHAPRVPRASYVDGIRRDLNDAKTIAKLEVLKAGKRESEQSEINKEIKTIRKQVLQ